MPRLLRSDYDQAIRYLTGASAMMERTAASQTRGLRQVLTQAVVRLSSEARGAKLLIAEIQVLRQAAALGKELGQPDAATEILKAVAVLRDTAR